MSDRAASKIPPEARAGLMRAWIEILKERHPEVTWIARDPDTDDDGADVTSESLDSGVDIT